MVGACGGRVDAQEKVKGRAYQEGCSVGPEKEGQAVSHQAQDKLQQDPAGDKDARGVLLRAPAQQRRQRENGGERDEGGRGSSGPDGPPWLALAVA